MDLNREVSELYIQQGFKINIIIDLNREAPNSMFIKGLAYDHLIVYNDNSLSTKVSILF